MKPCNFDGVLRNEERVIYALRNLYQSYGYFLYKVSKFEEYDLYAYNKNFLTGKNVLTFTDTNGKLLALKPDVTLSIVKNLADFDGITYKLCYNENVYRTPSEYDGFQEIMQTGLECVGQVDRYTESEVIMLAMKSLETIGSDYILDLSHQGVIDGLLEQTDLAESERSEIIHFIETKNMFAIQKFCEAKAIQSEIKQALETLTELYAPISKALPLLKNFLFGEKMQQAYENLREIYEIMCHYGLEERLYLDFSVVGDVNYYDGIRFQGYVNGIPENVLSGGRYDRLLNRLGKKAAAIGFAVYLNRLERLEGTSNDVDVEALLLYRPDSDPVAVLEAQKQLSETYSSVMAALGIDPSIRFRKLFRLTDGGKCFETDD